MLDIDIKHAIDITNATNDNHIEMKEYSRLYKNVSENIKEYMSYLKGNYDSALVPTSSGDHILETVLTGASNITAFDLNRLSKYYAKLKIGAIQSLSKAEYVYYMYEKLMTPDVFNYFKNNLDDETRIFWEELYKNCSLDDINNKLFRNIGIISPNWSKTGIDYSKYCVENFTNYLDHYFFMQDSLEKAKINYIDANLVDLPDVLKDKYDLINLTNIYEYINRDIFGDGARIYSTTIHRLLPFLNENGKIMVAYLYKCSNEDIDRYINKDKTYAYNLALLNNHALLRFLHNAMSYLTREKTVMDKLYAFRNVQAVSSLKDLPLQYGFVKNVGIGQGMGNSDMALIYTKK